MFATPSNPPAKDKCAGQGHDQFMLTSRQHLVWIMPVTMHAMPHAGAECRPISMTPVISGLFPRYRFVQIAALVAKSASVDV